MSFIKRFFGKSKKEEEPEDIAHYDGGEDGMRNAVMQAQATFPKFLEELELELRRIVPAMEECFIKYVFETGNPECECEHMFVSELYLEGECLKGVLASEPQYTNKVKEGDTVVVDPKFVSDWLFVINGEAQGGFTFRYMWQTFSKEDRSAYADAPPFSYLKLKV